MTATDWDWGNLTVAGAFVAGVVVGGIAVMRVTRYVMTWLRRDQNTNH